MREGERQLEVNESEAWAEAGNKNASRKLQFNWNGVDRKVREEEVMAGGMQRSTYEIGQDKCNYVARPQLVGAASTGAETR